ncbi:hypothetical protein NF868_04610 [Bacillus zhangzhouensis]|nr:hypothetical protein NF868_04610 [Bacillus zhangzhouensis]
MEVYLENMTHFEEDLSDIEKNTGVISENIFFEVAKQIMFSSSIEESISVHRKIMLEDQESILKVDFQVKPPEQRDGVMYVGVIYSGHEVQK